MKGRVLTKLGEYERRMTVKRKLAPADLQKFADVVKTELEEYIPCMICAMLTSPANFTDTQGYSTFFYIFLCGHLFCFPYVYAYDIHIYIYILYKTCPSGQPIKESVVPFLCGS